MCPKYILFDTFFRFYSQYGDGIKRKSVQTVSGGKVFVHIKRNKKVPFFYHCPILCKYKVDISIFVLCFFEKTLFFSSNWPHFLNLYV